MNSSVKFSVGVVFTRIAFIFLWTRVETLWRDDMRLEAAALVAIGAIGAIAIGGAAVAWGKKVVNALR